MGISAVSVGAAVTPTVVKTYVSHYTKRSARRQKPTAHISYDEGLHLIRSFLTYASHHTVEDLQAFTAQWVPTPAWVRTENVTIPPEHITKAVESITTQLGPQGIEEVGGTTWWQWRRKNVELKGEWVEMRADFNARKQLGERSRRIMLYVHGGAYFFGSVDEHRYQIQRHARKLKARVFAPRYRLAPQFPFPCGLLDCLAAYLYLLSIHDKTEIVLAGDSAGGGMIMSMLCLLRDQSLPLPAGAILISPWVDLTHSFPSVAAENELDYIPAHGFMHKPSISWPPPNDDEIEAIRSGAGKDLLKGRNRLEKKELEREAAQGFSVRKASEEDDAAVTDEATAATAGSLEIPTAKRVRRVSDIPGPQQHLQIQIGDKVVELKDQIQMYATNQLISHPMVSPVLQPSLGGLPPLLIMVGGGEMLRDEQIYLAHKAAHPERYPLGDEYRARYDPSNELLNKYPPTPVQLQVWEDLCHVAPTLSFTRPAKFMYRSVAQFGAWALARAQGTDIEIVDDDEISVISSDSSLSHKKSRKGSADGSIAAVGKAGDPIPPFRHHMIRQLVDRHGNIKPLADASELLALQMPASEIGVIKPGPVHKWMDAKLEWDSKYARIKRKVQKRRITDLVKADTHQFEGEYPPPSALAGRRKDEDMMMRKPKKSYWLAIWSGWGSKHDQDTIKREEEVVGNDNVQEKVDKVEGTEVNEEGKVNNVVKDEKGEKDDKDDKEQKSSRLSLPRQQSDTKSRSRSRTRRRTTIVSYAGQIEGEPSDANAAMLDSTEANAETAGPQERAERPVAGRANSVTDTHLTPLFIPKFKAAPHLRSLSKDATDTSSIRTGHSLVTGDNASTRAVFSAPGVSREQASSTSIDESANDVFAGGRPTTARTGSDGGSLLKIDDQKSNLGGYDTPYSRRSVERLMSHQIDLDNTSLAGTEHSAALAPKQGPLRSPSSTAIVQHEGIVDRVEGAPSTPSAAIAREEDDATPTQEKEIDDMATPKFGATKVVDAGEVKTERPGMYNRSDSAFQTAMEHL